MNQPHVLHNVPGLLPGRMELGTRNGITRGMLFYEGFHHHKTRAL